MDPKLFTDLRNILTNLYPDEPSIRRLTADAGVDLSRVVLNSAATNNWHAILTEMEKNNRVDILLSVVEHEYGSNQAFLQACETYRRMTDKPGSENAETRASGNEQKASYSQPEFQYAERNQNNNQSQGNLRMQNLQNINLPKLRQALFDAAKGWQLTATVCDVIILLINIVVMITSQLSEFLAVAAILLTVLNVFFLWRSDKLREEAEATLRRLEFYNGLGWAISRREVSNLLASSPKAVKQAAYSSEICEYWTSTSVESPLKLLENLEESAWWSKHLARRMAQYAVGAGLVTFLVVLITLLLVLQSPAAQPASDMIAKVIILVVLFVISSGYVRLAFDYDQFARAAEKAETQAVQLQENPGLAEIEAIKLLHDYQIDRAVSPLLPSWLWRLVEKDLNELWKQRAIVEQKA